MNYILYVCMYVIHTKMNYIHSLHMSDYNLTQHVKYPTHICGNMLDLLFTIDAHLAINNVRVADVSVADHYLVSCDVAVSRIKGQVSSRTRRSLDELDTLRFVTRLDGLMGNTLMTDNVNTYCTSLQSNIRGGTG